jgi:hypothetical protein
MVFSLRPRWLPALLGLACGGRADDTGAFTVIDRDGDGWEAAVDCDDLDAASFPTATELCNGKDDDCDGIIDEADAADAPSWALDADGDGYGGLDLQRVACAQPTGHVRDRTDCDDGDPAVRPGGVEACDGLDNDCDGVVDEGALSTFFVDEDGDGYGDPGRPVEACADDPPAGVVGNPEDCADDEPGVGPEAPEVCDGVDNDCDGAVDEADAVDARVWYLDRDGDAWGDAGFPRTACAAPAGHVAVGGDCDDFSFAASPDRTEVCDGADNDCDGLSDEPDAADAPLFLRDADGDGHPSPLEALGQHACALPPGYVAPGPAPDCDDAAPGVNPSASEVCNGDDDDCDGLTDEPDAADASTWYIDQDDDGYGNVDYPLVACDLPAGFVADASDCDDGAADARPGGSEVCDGLDNDCDGTTDGPDAADVAPWYLDYDGDGRGRTTVAFSACDAPDPWVAVGDDCDDTDAAVYPGAVESCNGVDDDCEGTVDGADAVDATRWYADLDRDTFGDAANTQLACTQPAGFVRSKSDCNDRDPAVRPGATEVCDGVDNDCDPTTDEDDSPTASTWYADLDQDGVGVTTARQTACTSPGALWSLVPGDCDDAEPARHPGRAEVCDGVDNDCDTTVDEVATPCYASGSGSEQLRTTTGACVGQRTWVGQRSTVICEGCDFAFEPTFGAADWGASGPTCSNIVGDAFEVFGFVSEYDPLTGEGAIFGYADGAWTRLGVAEIDDRADTLTFDFSNVVDDSAYNGLPVEYIYAASLYLVE